ncbi:MAG: DUF4149 domain-containing protein [Burkholderiales bacterium]
MKFLLYQRLPLFLAAFWWASLGAVGFLVVPLLFVHLATPALAGTMAAKLFTAQTWVGVVCATCLLLISRSDKAPVPTRLVGSALIFLVLGLLLALLGEFAIAPRIVSARALAGATSTDLKLWHSLGSAVYLVQWICAGVTLWRLSAPVVSEAGDTAAVKGDDPD